MTRSPKWSYLLSALLFALALSLVPSLVRAQGEVGWIQAFGSTQDEEVTSVAVDSAGNVYVAGAVRGANAFIRKLDAAGNPLWSKQLPSTASSTVNDIVVDKDGEVYITGAFQGTVDFDPGSGAAQFESKGQEDIFFAKLTADGSHIWAFTTGSDESDSGDAIAIDGAKNVYVTGSFEEVIDVRPGDQKYLLTSEGKDDVFVLRFDTNGEFSWARSMGGRGDVVGLDIAVVSGRAVFVTGEFEGKVDLKPDGDPDYDSERHRSQGDEDIFIVKFDTGGSWSWARSIGGINEDEGPTLDVDGVGNVYITGSYESTADFDPASLRTEALLTSAGEEDIFLVKLDFDGRFIWAKSMGGASSDGATGIDVDASGNIHITGEFEQSVDFDPGSGQRILRSAGADDVFIAKYIRDGTHIWSTALHGSQDERGGDVAVTSIGDVFAAGEFKGSVEIDQQTISAAPHTATHYDGYLLKLLQPVYPPRAYLPQVQQLHTLSQRIATDGSSAGW